MRRWRREKRRRREKKKRNPDVFYSFIICLTKKNYNNDTNTDNDTDNDNDNDDKEEEEEGGKEIAKRTHLHRRKKTSLYSKSRVAIVRKFERRKRSESTAPIFIGNSL